MSARGMGLEAGKVVAEEEHTSGDDPKDMFHGAKHNIGGRRVLTELSIQHLTDPPDVLRAAQEVSKIERLEVFIGSQHPRSKKEYAQVIAI